MSDQYTATFFVSPHAVEMNGCQSLWKSVLSVDRFALNAKISKWTIFEQKHVRVHTHLLYAVYIQKRHVFVHIKPNEAWSSTSCHTFSDLGSCVLPVDVRLKLVSRV